VQEKKIRIKYSECGHSKLTTLEKVGRGEDLECEECKKKKRKSK